MNVYPKFSHYAVFIILSSCSPLISNFDQYAYTQATSLKVDSDNLMDHAVENYSNHNAEIQSLRLNLQKIYEYNKNIPKNVETTKQWLLMLDSSRESGSLGYFFVEWRTAETKTLSRKYITDRRKIIDDAFDKIAQLESNKIKK